MGVFSGSVILIIPIMIYGIVFHLIHTLIDLFITLKYTYRYLWTIFSRVVDFSVVTSEYSSCQLSKVPFHLGVIIGEDHISLSDISNLILWCLCFGIRHISIYDLNGIIKENREHLYECVTQKKSQFFKKSHTTYQITFNYNTAQHMLGAQATNGHKVQSIYVDLVSRDDGKSKIVQAATKACLHDSRVLSYFHSSEFDVYIKDLLNLHDPDLVICFGPVSNCSTSLATVNSLMGYLPWHVRLSEILPLPTHRGVQFTEFLDVLKKYNHCEQRLGK